MQMQDNINSHILDYVSCTADPARTGVEKSPIPPVSSLHRSATYYYGLNYPRIYQAFHLILNVDRELFSIILLSLKVSGLALIIATVFGLPAGALLGLARFSRADQPW